VVCAGPRLTAAVPIYHTHYTGIIFLTLYYNIVWVRTELYTYYHGRNELVEEGGKCFKEFHSTRYIYNILLIYYIIRIRGDKIFGQNCSLKYNIYLGNKLCMRHV